jgi:hypothetical protein
MHAFYILNYNKYNNGIIISIIFYSLSNLKNNSISAKKQNVCYNIYILQCLLL